MIDCVAKLVFARHTMHHHHVGKWNQSIVGGKLVAWMHVLGRAGDPDQRFTQQEGEGASSDGQYQPETARSRHDRPPDWFDVLGLTTPVGTPYTPPDPSNFKS